MMFSYQTCYDIAKQGLSKKDRGEKFSELKEALLAEFSEEEQEEHGKLISKYFSKTQKEAVRELVLAEGIRLDGRKTTDIRPIWCEVDYLPSTHGSSSLYPRRNPSIGNGNARNFKRGKYY